VARRMARGNLAGVGRKPRRRFVFRKQEHEASEILSIVLDAFGKDHAFVVLSSAAPGNGGGRFVALGKHFTDAAGGVSRERASTPDGRKRSVRIALGPWVRGHGTKTASVAPGTPIKWCSMGRMVSATMVSRLSREKFVDAHDRTSQRVFDGREKCVGGALIDGAEGSVKTWRGARW